jgi:hypothetical protein
MLVHSVACMWWVASAMATHHVHATLCTIVCQTCLSWSPGWCTAVLIKVPCRVAEHRAPACFQNPRTTPYYVCSLQRRVVGWEGDVSCGSPPSSLKGPTRYIDANGWE